MVEKFPVVRRVSAIRIEVDNLMRVELLRTEFYYLRGGLVHFIETEPGILQLCFTAHQRWNALQRVVDELGEVADERMVVVLEMKFLTAEERN